MKLHEGDHVLIIAGKYRGQDGVIKKILHKKQRLILDDVIKLKKTKKPTKDKPEGGYEMIDGSIDVSNVMFLTAKAKPIIKNATRLGYKFDKKGIKYRFNRRMKRAV